MIDETKIKHFASTHEKWRALNMCVVTLKQHFHSGDLQVIYI